MRHDTIHVIAQTLCDCDGRDWMIISPAERDRYVRIAIMVDHRLNDPQGSDLVRDDEPLLATPAAVIAGSEIGPPT